MKKLGKYVATGAALTVAAFGPTSSEAHPTPKPAAAMGAIALAPPQLNPFAQPSHAPQTPDQAREAITHNMTCKLTEAKATGPDWFDTPANLTMSNVNVTLETSQSRDSLAAQEQYADSDDVLWRKVAGNEIFGNTATGYVDRGTGMLGMGAGFTSGTTTEMIPSQPLHEGDPTLIYLAVGVKTGSTETDNWRETVTKIPCGTLTETNGDLHISHDIPAEVTITTYTEQSQLPAEPYTWNPAGQFYAR